MGALSWPCILSMLTSVSDPGMGIFCKGFSTCESKQAATDAFFHQNSSAHLLFLSTHAELPGFIGVDIHMRMHVHKGCAYQSDR